MENLIKRLLAFILTDNFTHYLCSKVVSPMNLHVATDSAFLITRNVMATATVMITLMNTPIVVYNKIHTALNVCCDFDAKIVTFKSNSIFSKISISLLVFTQTNDRYT